MSESDDYTPQLSAYALAALKEFYTEQSQQEHDQKEMPQEDWQMSQFWYDETTSQALADEALSVVKNVGSIVCISCPTLFKKLQECKPETCTTKLLEFDRRFEKYGTDFSFYDYNSPLDLPSELQNSFDLVVLDPPFLSEECLRKTAQTVKYLAREKILLCTGAVMENVAEDALGVKMCSFIPHHKNNLANEFRCYTNYTSSILDKRK